MSALIAALVGLSPAEAPAQTDSSLEPGVRRTLVVNGLETGFRWCPPGTFQMGAPDSEPRRENDETRRTVELTSGFWMMETEVTQDLYEIITSRNNSLNKGGKMPMQRVTWYGAVEFANELSKAAGLSPAYSIDKQAPDPSNLVDGKSDSLKWTVTLVPGAQGFRLPTEAQWEYACRAGTGAAFALGNEIDATLANFNGEVTKDGQKSGIFLNVPTPVGSYKPNGWNLHDMHGNMQEWCWDWYAPYPAESAKDPLGAASGRDRVIRSGWWRSAAHQLRSASREKCAPGRVYDLIGLRLIAPSLPEKGLDVTIETPLTIIRKLNDATYATFAEREQAVIAAALAASELDVVKDSWNPMVCWTAQLLYKAGRNDEANQLVRGYVAKLTRQAQDRIKRMEQQKADGTFKSLPVGNGLEWGEPHVNGFALWGIIQVYVRYKDRMDQQLRDEVEWICTKNTSWFGSTGNLSFLIPFNLYMTEKLWGSDIMPADGRYGARGEAALKSFYKRMDYTVSRGSPEFASRPYLIANIGILQNFDNPFIDPELAKRARIAYEVSVCHAAGTWLRGNWITPAGRSYPAYFTQVPSGNSAMLWPYFGGPTPPLHGLESPVYSVAEAWRPHPMVVNAATQRDKPYLHRSRFDGANKFQSSYINRNYGVFSTAVSPPEPSIWGQCYPYGVMFDQPDLTKASICWMTVPCFDDKPLTNHTQGVASRFGDYLQREGTLMLVANNLRDPEHLPKIREDVKGHQQYSLETRSILGYVPDGYVALIDDAAKDGRIFLDYGSVLIAFSASQPFTWKPRAGTFSGRSPSPEDSEFRIAADNAVLVMETAHPDEFPAATPAKRLAAFKAAIVAKTELTLGSDVLPPAPAKKGASPGEPRTVAKGTYKDRFGHVLEKSFHGSAKVDGVEIDYASWPLIDNPWMHQDWDGNIFTLTDGKTVRTYDLTNWTITEKNR